MILLAVLCASSTLWWAFSEAAITLKKSNFACSALDGGISNTATSAVLVNGSRFPQSGTFRAVIWGANYADPALDPAPEIVNATHASGDMFTLMRGLEDTSARTWASGDNFALTITKGVLDEYEAEIAAQHDDRYYTESELQAGVLNTIYYTEAEIDAVRNANGESVLGADFDITAVNDTWADTGLSVTLPSAGTYLLYANVRFQMKFSSGSTGYMEGKLYNSTDGADLANSERILSLSSTANETRQGTTPMTALATVSTGKTIKLYVRRGNATAWTFSSIKSDSYGRTAVGYVRIR